jgi:hypothetical protein
MKTILKYIFSFALGSTMLTSCDLDTIPTTYVDAGSVFGKTGDAEKVLNGGWNYLMETFNSYANPGYGAMLRANDAMGSDVVLNSKYGFRTHNEFSAIYGKGGTNTLSWLLAYRVINDCNGVLDNIDAAEGTQADRNRIKGQALALRGFLYLHHRRDNPHHVADGPARLLRGGGWSHDAGFSRCSKRHMHCRPTARFDFVGFRLVLDSE